MEYRAAGGAEVSRHQEHFVDHRCGHGQVKILGGRGCGEHLEDGCRGRARVCRAEHLSVESGGCEYAMVEGVHGVSDAHFEQDRATQLVGHLLARETLDESLQSIAGERGLFVALFSGEFVHSLIDQDGNCLG
jgi:hypothetical protein